MANVPPPYTEQANPPMNPGYVDPSKGVQAGYPPQQGYPPQPGYPPQSGYPPQQPQQPQYYPPPQGMAAPAQQGQQQTIVIAQPVATGNCPVCRAGMLTEDFTCCGICLAIFCFPLGLICCFLMRERRCTSCGARV